MYCSACGTQIAPGLSFCNRCGANLKERSGNSNTTIPAYLTAVTVIGVIGLVILLGGTMALAKKAQLDEGLIGVFMLFTFLIVGTIVETRWFARRAESSCTTAASRARTEAGECCVAC